MREYTPVVLPQAKEKIVLGSIPPFEIPDWDLSNPKTLAKFFFNIERICRNSRSYKRMINFLKEYVDMAHCSFYKNTNGMDMNDVNIHIHHEPFTLFDIVSIIYAKRVANHEIITENQIAKEVMWNHYRMAVGLIPLSESVHDIVHSGFLFIPTTNVFGYYRKFFEDYEPYIDPRMKAVLANNEKASLAYDYAKETKVLHVSTVYIDPSGSYDFPQTKDIIELLKRKIKEFDSEIENKQIL